MARRRLRRVPGLGWRTPIAGAPGMGRLVGLLVLSGGLLGEGMAHADRNDLRLINLCDTSQGNGCSWVTQTPTRTTVALDSGVNTRFRSLMSELGTVVAPRLQTPADTLGFAGIQLSADLDVTQISNGKSFWNGVQGVQPNNPNLTRPPSWLTTVGAFARKGLPASFELGAGAVNVLQSGMWAVQGYLKFAINEGFHDLPLPSLAARVGLSDLLGTDQVTLRVYSLDVAVSKRFGVAGTWQLEPYLGWDALLIDAASGVVDATPDCDADTVAAANPSNSAAVAALPRACQAQAGTSADYGANFRFPSQSLITRSRWFGGAKLKLWKLFLVGQVARTTAGGSRDTHAAMGSADDQSGGQTAVSLSAGFDL
jgi:hypothetical protein